MADKTVAIVGGGVSGLAFAHRLHELSRSSKIPLRIVVLEDGPDVGGVVSTESRDGFLLEKGPDAFLSQDKGMMDLCRTLGLEEELIGTERSHRRTFVVHRGKLCGLPEGFHLIAPKNIPAFLATPLFSPTGKLRMLAECWVPKGQEADESIASFVRRRFGQEALERVGQPMIAGIYSGDPEELSLRSTMPRFLDAEKEHGSVIRGLRADAPARGVRYGLFVSFKGGMSTLTDALALSLGPGAVKTSFRVDSVSREEDRWRLVSERGDKIEADAVCFAVSARAASRLLRPVSAPLSRLLSEVTYQSVATLHLAFDASDITHPLDGFGFVVPRTEMLSLTACTFTHRKFAGRAAEGKSLLRAFVGGAFGKKTFDLPDDDLKEAVCRDLVALLGLKKRPSFAVLHRWTRSLPQYRIGHGPLVERIEKEESALPNLSLTGASYRGTGIPDCVRDARLRAERLWSNLKG